MIKVKKLLTSILCVSMLAGNVTPVFAAEVSAASIYNKGTTENVLKETETLSKGTGNYFVTIPKTVSLGIDKQGAYSVKVEGDIPFCKQVYVSPIDGIKDSADIDFYIKNQNAINPKNNAVATITHTKFYWSHEEVSAGYEETDNYIVAKNLSAGIWKGTFQMEIGMRTDPSHIHDYVGVITKEPSCTETGEKTYTCECGDSYIEKIPALGHSYGDDDVCIRCEELHPDHKHTYTSAVTKEPTCTEEGERTYICKCGDIYTEKISATGQHDYNETVTKEPTCIEEGERTYTCKCGDTYIEKIPAIEHSYIETITKQPTCIEEGVKTYTCEHCGDTYTEKIPAIGHNFVDGECTNCGEIDSSYHNWKPLYFNVSGLPVTKTADGYVSGYGKSVTQNNDLIINVPDWYPINVSYTYNYEYQYDPYCSGYLRCGDFSFSKSSTTSSTSGSNSGSKTMSLKPGKNTIAVVAQCTNGTKYGSVRWLVRGIFPSLSSLLNKTQHYCINHGEYEKHYSTCVDTTKDEYYFCSACGLQFRHRCKFDDSDINFANCEGGDVELTCIDDYYNGTRDLFATCSKSSIVHFNGLGHDWQPWIVQVNPTMSIKSDDSKYAFTKSNGTNNDTYKTNIAIGDKSLGSTSSQMELEIILPDNFSGTYIVPVTYNISSSSFTKIGYRIVAYCSVSYADNSSKSYLSYDLGYSSSSTGTTNGTMNIELHAGKNVISFRTNASTNLSSWQTGSNGGPSGSVSFSVPHTPFYIFEGNEVHKCSRCNIEETHTDKLYVTDRKEPTCISDGYIKYTCDDCGLLYDETLPKHPDDHTDKDGNYICDDCGKDLKTCEEFGHLVEHIQRTYEIPVTYSVSSGSKWYVDDGFYRLKLEAGKTYNSQGLTITYNVPSDFPGTYYSDRWRYIIVYNGENGGVWSYESTASTGKHKGGPYTSSGYVPLTFKAGTCSINISCYSLSSLANVGTQFAVGITNSISLDVDVYHCTRCGRTETYDFSNETSGQSLNDYKDYPDEDVIYAEDVSLSENNSTVQEDKDIIDNTETSTENENDETSSDSIEESIENETEEDVLSSVEEPSETETKETISNNSEASTEDETKEVVLNKNEVSAAEDETKETVLSNIGVDTEDENATSIQKMTIDKEEVVSETEKDYEINTSDKDSNKT